MEIHKIVNPYRLSNTFVIETTNDKVVLVDVGGPSIDELSDWLSGNDKKVDAVLLTHEHADHCVGVNALYAMRPFQLFCSTRCALNIANSRQNYSFYTDEIPTFEISLPVNTVADGDTFNVNDLSIMGIETPGHSPGGMCFLLNDIVFTGDTVLNNIKSPLTFPHSNRNDYKNSLAKLKTYLRNGITAYPGHGEPFNAENAFLNLS